MHSIQLKRLIQDFWAHRNPENNAQRQIQMLQAQLADIVENSNDAIIGKNLDGIITSWNQGAEHLYGYSAREAIGHSISMLVPHQQADETARILDRIKRGEHIRYYETQRVRKDGTIVDVSLTILPIKDTRGHIIGASKIARDITPLEHVEQMLQESETRFRNLIDTAPLAILIINAQGILTLVNDQVTALFGYDREELLGQPVERLLPEQLRTLHRHQRERYVTAPTTRIKEGRDLTGRRKDGTVFPIEIGLSHFQTSHGLVVLAFITDITERVRLYAEIKAHADTLEQKVGERTQELREALEKAQSADRAKSIMLATVTHEMRTPLSSIVGFSNLVLHRQPDQEKTFEYVNAINAEGRRLASLINDFLDLQRIQMGYLEFHLIEVDLADLVREVIQAQDFDEAQIQRLAVDLESGLRVVADTERIRQVIRNLLSNALKFAPEGEISLTVHAGNGEAIFSIHDAGIGIPADELGTLFQHFFRGQAAEEQRIPGTGLGLALCKELITAHSGRIWAESPGAAQGATFRFALPLAQV